MSTLSLRFVAGPNLGAHLSLAPGEYLLGNTPECGLQIDEPGEALALRLRVAPDLTAAAAAAVGRIFLNGSPLGTDFVPLAHGSVLALGLTAAALLDEGESLPKLNLAALGLAAPAAPEEAAAAPEPEAEEKEAEAQAQAPEQTAAAAAAAAPAPEPPPAAVPPPAASASRQRLSKTLLTAAFFIVLCLMLTSLIAGSSLFGSRAAEREALDSAQQYLNDGGFFEVKVEFNGEVLVFTGTVPSQADLNRLTRDLPQLPLAAVFNVSVHDGLLTAVERAAAVHGAAVRASYLENKGKGEILLKGYVRDPYLEAQLVTALAGELKHVKLKAAFTSKEALERLLTELLPPDLQGVALYPDRYAVFYDDKLTLEQQRGLHQLQAAAAARLEAPLILAPLAERERSQIELYGFTNRDLHLRTPEAAANEGETPAAAQPQQLTAERGFDPSQVVGVTMEPMRFVSMADGSRYFEGSVMPGGAVLREISVHALTLEQHGEIKVHELR